MAEAAAARAADAEKLADLAETIRDVGRDLDASLFGIAESGRVLGELIDEIYGLGLAAPNHQQAYSLGWRAIAAALMNTPASPRPLRLGRK
jgi:hypothetical protein